MAFIRFKQIICFVWFNFFFFLIVRVEVTFSCGFLLLSRSRSLPVVGCDYLLLSVVPWVPEAFLQHQHSTFSSHETLQVCASRGATFHTLSPSSAAACYCWLLDARFMWAQEILGSPASACFLISVLKIIGFVTYIIFLTEKGSQWSLNKIEWTEKFIEFIHL